MRPVRGVGLVPLLLLAGCSAATGTSPVAGTSNASVSVARSEVQVSAIPDPAPNADPSLTPQPTPPGCAPTTITIVKGSPPPPVCLTVGTDLHLASGASAPQHWSLLESSDSGILSCRSVSHPDGSITGTCHAVALGTATVSTTTAPFAGDPRGPQLYRWQLTVQVKE